MNEALKSNHSIPDRDSRPLPLPPFFLLGLVACTWLSSACSASWEQQDVSAKLIAHQQGYSPFLAMNVISRDTPPS